MDAQAFSGLIFSMAVRSHGSTVVKSTISHTENLTAAERPIGYLGNA